MSKIIDREINTLEEIVNRETWRRGECNQLPPSSFAIRCFLYAFLVFEIPFTISICIFALQFSGNCFPVKGFVLFLFLCVFVLLLLSIEPRVNGKVTRVYITSQYTHVSHYSFVCCYTDSKKNASNRHSHYIYWKKSPLTLFNIKMPVSDGDINL